MPLSLRLPGELRQRVRSFAAEHQLEEATAIRFIIAEHLNELESARELAEAEAWQRAQAIASWERVLAGKGRFVPRERVDEIFRQALGERYQSSS